MVTMKKFKIRGKERGIALPAVIMVLVLLLSLGVGSQVYTSLDLKSTSHYKTGGQALFAAESGVLHALSTMNSMGVLDFNEDVVQRWDGLYGDAVKTIPGRPDVSYQVSLVPDADDPADAGAIVGTGLAPGNAQRSVRVGVRKAGINCFPGAVYVPCGAGEPAFDTNNFEIAGANHDRDRNAACPAQGDDDGDDDDGDDDDGDDDDGDDDDGDDDDGDDDDGDDDDGDDDDGDDDDGDDDDGDDDDGDDDDGDDDDGDDDDGDDDDGDDDDGDDDDGDDDDGDDDDGDDDDGDDDDGDDDDDDDDDRVTICHYPPGNPDNAHTITIDENALPAHQAHGDTVGSCPGDATDDDCCSQPGIATCSDAERDSFLGALNGEQEDNVSGSGGEPSVVTGGGPSTADIEQFVSRLLNRAGVVTLSSSTVEDTELGTEDVPQITHLTNSNVTLGGDITGYGILITDGKVTLQGNTNFTGWIIARGEVVFEGEATVLGSLWSYDLKFKDGSNASVEYCFECLRDFADAAGGNLANLTRKMRVCSWQEVL